MKNVMEPVKESVTNDFSWICDEAFQEMGGRDYEDQTDLARCMEDVARGILRKLGLPTETEANLDVGELPGDPVDLFRAIWDEATGMMIQGLAASPCCARRILHLARAVEQWHDRDITYRTPLHVAAAEGHKEVVDLLSQQRADVAANDNDNQTPLHVAAMRGDKEVVDLLIQRGADLSARETTYRTPLHVAAMRGHKEVVDLLIQRGADLSARDITHRTPLHVAAMRSHKEVVDLLIQRGADLSARDITYRTPLYAAAMRGRKEVVDLLIRHGADVAACDKYNKTPLCVAAQRGHKEVVDLFMQRGAGRWYFRHVLDVIAPWISCFGLRP